MGLFDLFGRKEKRLKEAIDLSVLSTDIHSHLIPESMMVHPIWRLR